MLKLTSVRIEEEEGIEEEGIEGEEGIGEEGIGGADETFGTSKSASPLHSILRAIG
jgi:hypothetical protein